MVQSGGIILGIYDHVPLTTALWSLTKRKPYGGILSNPVFHGQLYIRLFGEAMDALAILLASAYNESRNFLHF